MDTLRANSNSFPRPRRNRYHRTPQQIAELKKKSRCKRCGLCCHWDSDHTADGTLKSGMKASKNPLIQPYKESSSVYSILYSQKNNDTQYGKA